MNRVEKLSNTLAPMAKGNLSHVKAALESFEDPGRYPDPCIVPCWVWTRGKATSRPFIQMRPAPPCHPMTIFYQGSYRRICAGHKCVNPWHFIPHPRGPTVQRSEEIMEAEGELDNLRPASLEAALKCLREKYPPAVIVSAYRFLRKDGFLKPAECNPVRRGYERF